MATKITLPQLGESVHEGTIGKWLKQVGDPVEEYEPLVEIITDKVNAEVPSPITGTLSAILVQEGETVEVGALLGEMTGVEANAPAQPANRNNHNHNAAGSPDKPALEAAFAAPAAPQAAQLNQPPDRQVEEAGASFPNGRASGGWYDEDEEDTFAGTIAPGQPTPVERKKNRYTPSVRRLAEEHHLDLEKLGLWGSGIGGRITRDDVLMYLEQQRKLRQPVPTRALPQEAAPGTPPPVTPLHDQVAANALRETPAPANRPASLQAAQPKTPPPASVPAPQKPAPEIAPAVPGFSEAAFSRYTPSSGEELLPLTPMRRAIAEHMARSVQTSPHAWTIVEVDMTRLVRHRAKIKEEFKRREGLDLTYLPFMLLAVVEGLRRFPALNASWWPDGSGIILKRDLNLGVAIDVPDGLVVPVIQRADEKSLVGLARALNDLINRARNKKLNLADVQGGTFTVNNPGAFGSVMSQPIINQPQAAIITMEAIVKRPVVLTDAEGNDNVVVRSMMNLCLSFDHRVVDGAEAGRFLQSVRRWLETQDFSRMV